MHQPVLYHSIIHALRPFPGGRYVDGTVGAGGHAWGILEASSPDGQLLGLDLDPQALQIADERLAQYGNRKILIQASYATLSEQLETLGWEVVDGILLDLGVSSMQLDTPERGFSFRTEAPLDMRFDPGSEVRAQDLVNELSERDLADLLYQYGEERRARQIAKAIVAARPIKTTTALADIVKDVVGVGDRHIHPATRSFQALRIATNRELDSLAAVLPQTIKALAPGGRVAVISFHSLEDRLVKVFFKEESQDCLCPPDQPVCTCEHHATLRIITRRPIRPEQTEIEANPRARSARLRIAEKL
jgi:16S rRNA (cytosine1402-N4)-methyltransferase